MITNEMRTIYDNILAEIRKHPTCMTPGHDFHDLNTADHIETVTSHAQKYIDHFGEIGVLIAMFHDLGKLEAWDEETKSLRNHEVASERIAREAGLPEVACRVIGLHSWVYNIHQVSPKGMRKFVRRLTEGVDAVVAVQLYRDLMEADASGFSPKGCAQRVQDITAFEEKVSVAMEELGIPVWVPDYKRR